ncbi:MAG: protein phosphatase 2C domain-containing protein [Elusimicrobia bacterium]|nr:protein phosphatase 2C domain-containing protein [Elusimicrobiota bacterium]
MISFRTVSSWILYLSLISSPLFAQIKGGAPESRTIQAWNTHLTGLPSAQLSNFWGMGIDLNNSISRGAFLRVMDRVQFDPAKLTTAVSPEQKIAVVHQVLLPHTAELLQQTKTGGDSPRARQTLTALEDLVLISGALPETTIPLVRAGEREFREKVRAVLEKRLQKARHLIEGAEAAWGTKEDDVTAHVHTSARKESGHINEDAIHINSERGYFIVADGMGGHAAGEVASQIAKEVISKEIESRITPETTPEEVGNILRGALSRANQAILSHMNQHPQTSGMGTTVSVGVTVKGSRGQDILVSANAGDSGVFVRRNNGKLETVSVEESLVAQQMAFLIEILSQSGMDVARIQKTNRITTEDVRKARKGLENLAKMDPFFKDLLEKAIERNSDIDLAAYEIHPRRNVVDNPLGSDYFEIRDHTIRQVELNPGDIPFAVSDGVIDNLGLSRMKAISRVSKTPQELIQKLADESIRIATQPKNSKERKYRKPDDISGAALLVEGPGEKNPFSTLKPHQPETVEYKKTGPIEVEIGDMELQIRAVEDMPFERMKGLNFRVGYFILDPTNPKAFKGLRDGETVEISKTSPHRFDPASVGEARIRISRKGDHIILEDLGSKSGSRFRPLEEEIPAIQNPTPLSLDPLGSAQIDRGEGRILNLKAGEGIRLDLKGWQAKLWVRKEPGANRLIVESDKGNVLLEPGEKLPIGKRERAPGKFMVLDQPGIASQHAEVILLPDGRVQITNLGSKHGISLRPELPFAPSHPTRIHQQTQNYYIPADGLLAIRLPSGKYIRVLRQGQYWRVVQGKTELTLSPGKDLHIGRKPEGDGEKLILPPYEVQTSRNHMTIRLGEDGRLTVTEHSTYGTELSQALRVTGRIPGRQSQVTGRIYAVDHGEVIRVDFEKDPDLAEVYSSLHKPTTLERLRGWLGSTAEEQFLRRTYHTIQKEIPYSSERAEELEKGNIDRSMVIGKANLKGRKGVCRHQALASAALLEKLKQESYLSGEIYYVVGNGHAWTEYVFPTGKSYILDVAQHYFGPIEEAKFSGTSGKDLYSKYQYDAMGSLQRRESQSPTPPHHPPDVGPAKPRLNAREGVGGPSGKITLYKGGQTHEFSITLDRQPETAEGTFTGVDAQGNGIAIATPYYVGVEPKGLSPKQLRANMLRQASAGRRLQTLVTSGGFPENFHTAELLGLGTMEPALAKSIFGREEEVPVLLMRRSPGLTLSQWLLKGRKLDPQDWEGFTKGIRTLHEKGVVHNDLNTDNILVFEDPRTSRQHFTIIDPEMARFRDETSPATWKQYEDQENEELRQLGSQFRDSGSFLPTHPKIPFLREKIEPQISPPQKEASKQTGNRRVRF